MWIPESIYRCLPVLYVAAGGALVPAFGRSGPSMMSAGVLVAAGVLTGVWRYRHRSEQAAPTITPRDEWAQRRAKRRQPELDMES